MADELQRIAAKLTGQCDIADVVEIRIVVRAQFAAIGRVMACATFNSPSCVKSANRPERQLIGPDSSRTDQAPGMKILKLFRRIPVGLGPQAHARPG